MSRLLLFTKPECDKCDYIKSKFDLTKLGIVEQSLTDDNHVALAELAYHELVETAEQALPILIMPDSKPITGAVNIKNTLKNLDN